MAPIERSDVVTNLIFLEKDSKHETEKPYKLQYDPGPGLPRWNCKNESHDGITIHDIRGKESKFTVENQGFEVAKLSTELSPEDFTDEDKVRKVYYNELKDLCKRRFGAQRVEVLEHGIRKRHHQFPISTGQPYNYDQPTSVVHIDFTQKAAMDTSQQAFNLIPTDFERVQCVK
jgi:hypothetical protein